MLSVKVDRIPILPIGDSVDQGPTIIFPNNEHEVDEPLELREGDVDCLQHFIINEGIYEGASQCVHVADDH